MKDGGMAFPGTKVMETPYERHVYHYSGMTLRDYFAGQTLAGLITGYPGGFVERDDAYSCADQAYVMADAMLAEREKEANHD
jgi:hypothetical protein